MKRLILTTLFVYTLLQLNAQPARVNTNNRNRGGGGFVGGGQGAQPTADQAFLGTLVGRRLRGNADVGAIVFTSPGTGEKTWEVNGDTKVMRNGYASNLKYAERGDTASVVLKGQGPFVRTLTLTSKTAATAQASLTPEQAKAKKAAMDAKLLKWHSDLAAKGDPRGFYEMGHHYEYGDGVETNKTKAVDFYTKAAAGGNEDAKLALKKINDTP